MREQDRHHDGRIGDPVLEDGADEVVERVPEGLHVGLLVLRHEVTPVGGTQVAGEVEVHDLAGQAGRGERRGEPGPLPRLHRGLLHQLAPGDLHRVLAGHVAEPRRQLDEPALGRVAVLPHAEHALVLVDREDDHGPRVLHHEAPEGLLLRVAGALDVVLPQRHDPVVAVQVGARGDRPGLRLVGQSGRRHAHDATGAGHRAPTPGTRRRSQHVHGHGPSHVRRTQPHPGGGQANTATPWRPPATTSPSTCAACSRARCWKSTSTITFRCLQPGASTFVDCVAEVRSATLNGKDLDLAGVGEGRIPLTHLAEENVLVVPAAQRDTGSGAGILRTVDPSDKLVYVWTSFEADDARRAWACFDQPDLKAPHAFTVLAHESWTVTSNGAPTSWSRTTRTVAGWAMFPDTPSLSTYVVVVNAGLFQRAAGGARRPQPRPLLPPVAQAVPRARRPGAFDVTAAGLAFGERFGQPSPRPATTRSSSPTWVGRWRTGAA